MLTQLLQFDLEAQHMIKGVVYDHNKEAIFPVVILEEGTENGTVTDALGNFELMTEMDSAHLSFRMFGFLTRIVPVTKDSILNIKLIPDDSVEIRDFYNSRWLSFGMNYDAFSTVGGLQLSNGVNEEPLIHFEDFQDKFLVKVSGFSDFENNYALYVESGMTRLRYVGRTTIQYNLLRFKDRELLLTDINLTSRIRYIHDTGLIFRTGYQDLDSNRNFGIGLGLEQNLRHMYFGFNSRFYNDYFHHEAYFQLLIPGKNFFTVRSVYNRIENKDQLTIGLNYAFVRNQK